MAPERIEELLDTAGKPFDQDDLYTQLMAEVNMGSGKNQIVVVVLSVRQFLSEPRQVMIIDESYCTHRLLVLLPFNLDETLPDHVPDQFRSVGVLALRLELVELFQKRFFKRETEPNEV